MNHLTYRPATLNDIPILIKMRIQFLKEIAGKTHDDKESILENELREYLRNHIPAGDFVCWLALNNEEVIATGGICLNSYPPGFEALTEKRAYIMNLYVLGEYRGAGVAGEIFKKLMDQAQAWQACIVALHTTPMAMKMYEKLGFKLKGNEMVVKVS